MTELSNDIISQTHLIFGPDLYMKTWELLEKKDRTPEETDELLHTAHASAYHWSKLEGLVDDEKWRHSFAIAHNQLTYVYIELGNAFQAYYHAKRCLDYFEKYGEGGFPKAYGYECLARTYDLIGDSRNRDDAIRKAIEAGNKIEDEQFRTSFFEELAGVRGYEDVISELDD